MAAATVRAAERRPTGCRCCSGRLLQLAMEVRWNLKFKQRPFARISRQFIGDGEKGCSPLLLDEGRRRGVISSCSSALCSRVIEEPVARIKSQKDFESRCGETEIKIPKLGGGMRLRSETKKVGEKIDREPRPERERHGLYLNG
ncbi:oxaA/YidC-like membrane insertion protein [Striga asiatica]|uniref:OxaA/YidC-like membrane insertion protein n=1 Tax=Striga asiatica TaxID=4170 RepID=A0A5A7P9J1_STRAF|nr:oxaA/YidC-like membrane insertion protein [Striga asiatica]